MAAIEHTKSNYSPFHNKKGRCRCVDLVVVSVVVPVDVSVVVGVLVGLVVPVVVGDVVTTQVVSSTVFSWSSPAVKTWPDGHFVRFAVQDVP